MLVQNNINPVLEDSVDEGVFSFGAYTLDAGQGVLLHDGVDIPLRPKTFDVLTYLVTHSRRLISRKELLETVWPDVIVTDDSLTQCMIEIRKALGDDQRKTVRTIPRRGYLFDLSVSVPANTVDGDTQPERQKWRQPSRWTLFAVAILAVAIGATWLRVEFPPMNPVKQQTGVHAAGEAAIAVLPFTDLSQEGDQAYLADGISEEVLNLLTRVSGLTVISRTSSFSIRDLDLDIISIAQRLNVTHVLEGSVRKSGDRVRVTVRLVDGESGVELWSQTFDNRLDDIFAMQTGIARAVTDVLASRLLGPDTSTALSPASIPFSANPEAWNLYLRGKYFYGRRSPGDIPRAQRNFEQALALDPNLAAAWIGLAGALNLRALEDRLPEEESLSFTDILPMMKYAIGRSLEQDPHNPEALIHQARLYFNEGNFETWFDLSYQAMQYGRNSFLVQSALAGVALQAFDMTTAVRLQRRAYRLNPVSFISNIMLADFLYLGGQLDDAAILYRQAFEINPNSVDKHSAKMPAFISILQNDYANAEALAELLPAGAAHDQVWSMLQYRAGNYAESNAALERLKQYGDAESRAGLAYVYAFRNEIDNAFDTLEALKVMLVEVSDTPDARIWFTELRTSGFLQPLHADSRWLEWETDTEQLLYFPQLAKLNQLLRQYAATELPVQDHALK